MSGKRVTQKFPFLLPLRKWQRKKMFYLKMRFDKNKYAKETSENLLQNMVFETSSHLLNEKSGFDMKYQINKVHNLKLAAGEINKIIINPNETFSFWQAARYADRKEPYRDGLNVTAGKISGAYGGGLCQLSNMLFWMFLHTPMTIVERHGHTALFFEPADGEMPLGIDAAINEGWLDLKVRNDTDNVFQIEISFDDDFMYGRILSQIPTDTDYSVFNPYVTYEKYGKKIFQYAAVSRMETDKNTHVENERNLYINMCEIGYELSDDIEIKEKRKLA